MNPTRLFILGALARGGPMHGHQIRRAAQIDHSELWADVKPGSLYAALKRMAGEGSIEVLRTEQDGNLPPRTIYAITDDGRAELHALRDEGLRETRLRPDPVDLALQYTGDLSETDLRAVIESRRQSLMSQLSSWQSLLSTADPYLEPIERVTFDHVFIRLRAELTWHEALLNDLSSLLKPPEEDP
jgi:DNA-binding PadR family transcriptional regulator